MTCAAADTTVERMHTDRIGPTYSGDPGSVPWLDLDDGYGVHLSVEDRMSGS